MKNINIKSKICIVLLALIGAFRCVFADTNAPVELLSVPKAKAADAPMVTQIDSTTNNTVRIKASGYGVIAKDTNGDWVVTFSTNAPPTMVSQAEAIAFGRQQLQTGFNKGVVSGVTVYIQHPELVKDMDRLTAKALRAAQADEQP